MILKINYTRNTRIPIHILSMKHLKVNVSQLLCVPSIQNLHISLIIPSFYIIVDMQK